MFIQCPNCQFSLIATKDVGKKAGSVIGMIGGASSTLSGAEIGGAVGMVADPAGAVVGSLLGALIGGVTGSIASAKLGEVVDERVLIITSALLVIMYSAKRLTEPLFSFLRHCLFACLYTGFRPAHTIFNTFLLR